jgi:hypothetical protein
MRRVRRVFSLTTPLAILLLAASARPEEDKVASLRAHIAALRTADADGRRLITDKILALHPGEEHRSLFTPLLKDPDFNMRFAGALISRSIDGGGAPAASAVPPSEPAMPPEIRGQVEAIFMNTPPRKYDPNGYKNDAALVNAAAVYPAQFAEYLKDSRYDVRKAVLQAFGSLAPTPAGAKGKVLAALEDEDPRLREQAARMTTTMGLNRDDVPVLVDLLYRGRRQTKYTVADLLGRMGGEASGAAVALERAMGMPDVQKDYSLTSTLRSALARVKAPPVQVNQQGEYECRRAWEQFRRAAADGNVSRALDALTSRAQKSYVASLENGSIRNDPGRLNEPLGRASMTSNYDRKILFPRTTMMNGRQVNIGVVCEEDYNTGWKISAF